VPPLPPRPRQAPPPAATGILSTTGPWARRRGQPRSAAVPAACRIAGSRRGRLRYVTARAGPRPP